MTMTNVLKIEACSFTIYDDERIINNGCKVISGNGEAVYFDCPADILEMDYVDDDLTDDEIINQMMCGEDYYTADEIIDEI